MELLDRPDRYLVYRWECDSAHASTLGLTQLIGVGDPAVTVIGGPPDPMMQLVPVVTAWEVTDDLFRICLENLALADDTWYALAEAKERQMKALMASVLPTLDQENNRETQEVTDVPT